MTLNFAPQVVVTPPALDMAGSHSLGQLVQQTIPFDDLQIRGPVERYLTLGQDIIPTLSMISAIAGKTPRLLQADAAARLLTIAQLNAAAKIQNFPPGGPSLLTVDIPAIFPVGSYVLHVDSNGVVDVREVTANPGTGNITLTRALQGIVNVGDTILSVPPVIAQPLPSQQAQLQASGEANVAAGNSVLAISGVAGLNIWLFDATLYTGDAAGAFGGFQDSGGVDYGQGAVNTSGRVFHRFYGGVPVAAGASFRVKNPGGAASNLWWSVSYTQL